MGRFGDVHERDPRAHDGILVVEDDADIRELISLILLTEGYPVRGVANGAEALRRLEGGERPCLILLDLMMPVMDGWRFMEEARRKDVLRSPVVVLSAARNAPAEAEKLGAQDCLVKPLEVDDVLRVAADWCARVSSG